VSVQGQPSPVAGHGWRPTGSQKLWILGAVAAAALAAVFITHLASTKHQQDRAQNEVGGLGVPFQPPPEPKPVPVAAPALPIPFAAPTVQSVVPPKAERDDALDSGIFSYNANDSAAEALRGKLGANGDNQNGEDDALSRALKASDLGATAKATVMRHPALTIPAGTVIPCILQTAINSQLVGFVDCVLPSEVRGATGTVTLLDRGTQIFGEIKSGLQQGQDRLFILWVRARTPQNVVIALSSPAADELGRAGAPGAVNNHFWQRFGAAILFSVIGYGPELASNALQHGGNNSNNNYIQFLSPQQQLANTVLQAQINIPPTLEKNQGDAVTIFTARDLDFSGVYDLRTVDP
jgi:type IV secretion system protein VirB10